MKSFTKYIQDKKIKDLPAMETAFGSHSKEKSKDLPSMETVFGSHSRSKSTKKYSKITESNESLDESIEPKTHVDQTAPHSKKEEEEIHKRESTSHHPALDKYTSDSSHLNGSLHKHYRKGEIGQLAKKHAQNLDNHLNKQKTKEDTHVFTGLPHSPHEMWNQSKTHHSESVKVHLPAYTSTSTNIAQANQFAMRSKGPDHSKHEPLNTNAPKKISTVQRHIMKIHVPKGTHAASIRDHSKYRDEHEILLHRGHHLEIHPRPTVHPDGTHVWHARIIGHDPKPLD